MADIERSPVITFKTEDSGLLKGVTSVKELKTAIAQLKDEIVRMRQAGEDTTKATTQLQAAQRELNTVMGLTKKGADGVEGSYDNLVAKLREAKTEWRALPKFLNGELNPAWESARQKVEQFNTELKNYDASVGVYTRNVGNYKSALEGFTGTLGQAAQVGGQFNNGLAAMSGIMGIVGADTSDMDDAMKNMRITVGLLQGARGFAGLIKQLGDYIKISVKSTTTTKADTVAKKANTEATTAMAGAETAAAGATTLLGVALKALGIGLIVSALAFVVAHLEDIVKWVTDLGVKLGIIKERNKDQLSLVEQTQKKYEEEKDTLDKQSKIMQAQGKSQKDILKFQIQEITASIKTKEAELASAQATVKRLEAHNWIQRVLNGENKEYKQMKKVVEELTAELKEQKKTLADTQFDLELEGYREQTENRKKAQTAAEKAKADAERKAAEALKKAQEIVKKGADEATQAIEKEQTELEKLDAKYAKSKKTIEEAVEALKTNTALTGDLKSLEEGLVALRTTYYRQRFELEAADKAKAITKSKEEEYMALEQYEKVYNRVLSLTKDRYDTEIHLSAAEQRELDTLKATTDYLRSKVELTDEVLGTLTGKTREELAKEFGEPLATAISMYFEKSDELKEAGFNMYENLFTSFEENLEAELDSGNFKAAELMAKKFYEKFLSEFQSLGFEKEFAEYFDNKIQDTINAAYQASETPGKIDLNPNNWFNDEKFLEVAIQKLARQKADIFELIKEFYEGNDSFDMTNVNEEVAAMIDKYFELEAELDAKQEELYNKRLKRFSNFFGQVGKYINAYGKSTGAVLSSVADFWEAELQAKVKNGKKTEEEAKKSFKAVKALQISTAVINTAAAVVQALADTTVPSYYVKAANAIAAGIAGAAEIVKISSTDFSASGSYSASNSTAPSITQTPAMVNTYGINPNDYAEAAAQNPVRVYVVESDITEAQKAARTRVEESTF